jgi:hypothetical protein
VIGVFGLVSASAQVERDLPRRGQSSLEDTRFVVGFMQNDLFLPNYYEPEPVLKIFVASEFDARVQIDYPDGFRSVLTVPANGVAVETVAPTWVARASETLQRKAITVTSDVPIVCYTLNSLQTSTDSYITIPVRQLGTTYRTMCYANDAYPPQSIDTLIDTSIRRSEFMVIATEPNTYVTITPSVTTQGGLPAGTPRQILMQPGEVYVVKSGWTPKGQGDLTGSLVAASAPVAVLSGHMRTSVPISTVYLSKDHLVEMMLPTAKWGTTFATSPFARVANGDRIRVMAAQPGTQITLTSQYGIQTFNLAAPGDVMEFQDVDVPVYWSSTKPVMLAQYMESRGSAGSAVADPAMVVIPSTSFYTSRAVFQFPALQPQPDVPQPQPFYYYINVIAEESALASLRVNNWHVRDLAPAILTQKVPGSNLYWAAVTLPNSTGSFVIECDSGSFCGMMYGMTYYDTYANMFALSYGGPLRPDRTPPKYALRVQCGVVEGSITDIAMNTDTAKLVEVTVQQNRTFNYQWALTPVNDSVGSTDVWAAVNDRWKDAQLVIHAWDHRGNGREWLYRYYAPKIQMTSEVRFATAGGKVCSTLVIRNMDTVAVRLVRASITGDPRFSFTPSIPDSLLLAARDSLVLTVCFDPGTGPLTALGAFALELPCGLGLETPLRLTSFASFVLRDLDFGAVRVGDTVCRETWIVNDGNVDLTLDSITIATSLPQYIPDIAALALPTILKAGDSLALRVCFTPTGVAPFVRSDTAHATPNLIGTVRYSGRGIRPDVRDILIDWGRRRTGTVNDSIAILSNLGEAACTLTLVSITGDSSQFPSVHTWPATIDLTGGDSRPSVHTYSPGTSGLHITKLSMIVDWALHDTVTVTLQGIGTLPAITAQDIDMGGLLVGLRRDSLARIYASSGSEDLTVSNITLGGPDAASFTIAPSILTQRVLAAGASVTDLISFQPGRLGDHVAWIDIEHDALPAYVRTTTRVNLYGNGLPLDTVLFDVSLLSPAIVRACQQQRSGVTVTNRGNVDMVVTGVVASWTGRAATVTAVPPIVVAVGQDTTLDVLWTPERGDAGPLVVSVTVNDTLVQTVRASSGVTSGVVTLQPGTETVVAPGEAYEIPIDVSLADATSFPVPLDIQLTIPRERVSVTVTEVVLTVTDATGSRPITAQLQWSGDVVRLELPEPLAGPFSVVGAVPAVALWKDVSNAVIETIVASTPCYEGAQGSAIVRADVCAGELRAVQFGTLPIVEVRIREKPARDNLTVELRSPVATVVQCELVSVTGHRVSIGKNLWLEKGPTTHIFTLSNIASGQYQLVVTSEVGSVGIPVVILK